MGVGVVYSVHPCHGQAYLIMQNRKCCMIYLSEQTSSCADNCGVITGEQLSGNPIIAQELGIMATFHCWINIWSRQTCLCCLCLLPLLPNTLISPARVCITAATWVELKTNLCEVSQSLRRPLLGPTPGWKCLLCAFTFKTLWRLRTMLNRC